MDREEHVANIVREVVGDFLRLSGQISSQSKKILVLAAAHERHGEIERLVAALSKESIVSVYEPGDIQASLIEIRKADIVVVPVVPLSVLSKVALLIDDEPMSIAIIQALLEGKDVVVSTSHVLPTGTARLSVPPGVSEKVRSYAHQLTQYGVRMTTQKKLHHSVNDLIRSGNSAKRPLVHARHVREWHDDGETVIELPDGALLTPLAKEEAKDLGLRWGEKAKGV